MRLLQREVFKELSSLFSVCVGSLLSLILIGRVLQMRELFMGLDLGLFDLLRLFFYLSPFFLLLLVPVACMLSVFLTFLRMSTDNELTALKAGGVNLYQMLPAPAIFCVLCAGLNLFVSLFGLSWGMDNFRNDIMELARTKTQLVIQPGVFNRQFPGLMVYAQRADNSKGELFDVLVEDRTRPDIKATIMAPKGTIITDNANGRILFKLERGHIYQQEQERMSVLQFGSYLVQLDLSRLLGGEDLDEKKPKEMSLDELLFLQANPAIALERDENYYRKVLVEIQKRLALPFACVVLGLFAVPLACSFQGLKRHYGLILALGMFMVYYTLFSVGLTTGEAGRLDPRIGLWLPNILFLVLGAAGMRMAVQEKSIRIMDYVAHLRLWKRRLAGGGRNTCT